MATPVISNRALNRALLARQHLLERSRSLPVADAVEHLVGLQAQAIMPPYLALWSRLEAFDPHALGALLTERAAVRMTLMRGTVHLVTTRDALTLRPLLQETSERLFNGTFRRRMNGCEPAQVERATREALSDSESPPTARELAAALIEQGIGDDLDAIANAVRVYAPLVQVTPRGVWGRSGQARYATIESWTGRELEREPSLDAVILRYLCAFGPASVMDVQKWSGLTRCAAVLERLRPQLLTFATEDGTELFDLPDAPRPDPRTPAPVRFLAEFDNVLLSHADRRRIIPRGETPWLDAIAAGRHVGNVLIDGMLRATWWIERQGGKQSATLTIQPLDRLSAAERRQATAEAERVLRFAAADAARQEVRVSPA